MSEGGFYLMPRHWQDYPMFGREAFSRRDAWVWLMENAAYADRTVDVAGKTVAILRGQLSYSLRFMAKAWEWDEAKVRRFLARAQKDRMIDARTDAGQTIITICDYNKIQRGGHSTDAPADAEVTQEQRSCDANNKQGKQGNEGKQELEAEASGAESADADADKQLPPEQPKLPIDQAFKDWGVAAQHSGWAIPRLLTDQRRKKLASRLREHGLEGWRAALTRACGSEMLGRDPPSWFDFDFITRNPENILKLLEGKYDGPFASHQPSAGRNGRTDGFDDAIQRLARGETGYPRSNHGGGVPRIEGMG